MPNELFLSLILPVYNYQDSLKENVLFALESFKREGFSFEIILVNDGSFDQSSQEMNLLAGNHSEIKTINFDRHHGKGYVVKQGMLQARGNHLFFTDIDLPYGLDPVLEGVKILERNDVDVVLGSRDIPGGGGILNYSLQRRITKRIFSALVSFIFRLDVTDTQCGLKGFKREAADKIFRKVTRNGFSLDVEVIYLIKKMGFQKALIPVFLHQSKSSTVSIPRDSIKMLKDLVGILINIGTNKYRI